MRRLSKNAGIVIGSILALSLLFNSVVYACSKLSSGMDMAMHRSSMATTDGMNEKTVERGPCSQHKQDICKTVRDRMISIQPSLSKAGDYQQPAPLLLPLSLMIDIPKHIAFSLAFTKSEIAFHSVFKLPLTLSFSVLRI